MSRTSSRKPKISCECSFFRLRLWWCSHIHAVAYTPGEHRSLFQSWLRHPNWARTEVMRAALSGPWRVPTIGAIRSAPNYSCLGPKDWNVTKAGRPKKKRHLSHGESHKSGEKPRKRSNKRIQNMMKEKRRGGWNKRSRALRVLGIPDLHDSVDTHQSEAESKLGDRPLFCDLKEGNPINSFRRNFDTDLRTKWFKFDAFHMVVYISTLVASINLSFDFLYLLSWVRRSSNTDAKIVNRGNFPVSITSFTCLC